jgi:hypothetical protein
MLLLPCSRGRAGAWIVKRAASTCYRPGVRPFDQMRRGARFRRSQGPSICLARPASITSYLEAKETYDPLRCVTAEEWIPGLRLPRKIASLFCRDGASRNDGESLTFPELMIPQPRVDLPVALTCRRSFRL